MDRTKFAQSRALIIYDDGTVVGTCSLHCAAIDMSLKIDKTPVSIQVADYGTKKRIDAETANWVIGGSKPGVMTRRAKWAFASQTSADAFIAANGGIAGAFEVALNAAFWVGRNVNFFCAPMEAVGCRPISMPATAV